MKKLVKQILSFLAVSGTGWLIDFSIYYILTTVIDFNVGYANFISGIPALTFVFFVSTKKIFTNKNDGLTLKQKYFIYFAYQMVLILSVSYLGQLLFNLLNTIDIIRMSIVSKYLKIICKIIITPITMCVNFVVMKFLSEKF